MEKTLERGWGICGGGRGDNEIKVEVKKGRCKILGILDKWFSKCGPRLASTSPGNLLEM